VTFVAKLAGLKPGVLFIFMKNQIVQLPTEVPLEDIGKPLRNTENGVLANIIKEI
jgi:hypothetical protein